MDSGYGFFRRRPDRQVNEADIAVRVPALADFIRATCHDHHLTRRPLAIGFSNGAIMSAALLLTNPDLLAGAILFRPLSPFAHALDVRLDGTAVLIIDGENDTRRSPGDGQHLAEQLRGLGAVVTHRVLPVGHSITGTDRQVARAWIRGHGL
ncbi:alpha/beta hydrolase [Janibacter sp. GS2]|uniref:alpha/beta hydrolase n=1 Tax=Janibacter sp. GS2 TaxID=3442646 RepID=UPI003EB9F215